VHGPRSRPLTAGLALAWLFATSGCTIFRDKREFFSYEHAFPTSHPAFRRSLDTFGNVMVDGNSAELLINGDQIFPAMLQAIRGARHTVNLESYIFSDDQAGRMFADAMIDAVRRGVEVRLLVDGEGGRAGALFGVMKKAGVKAYIYHPVRPWSLYRIGQRTHRKILVVDGSVCFTGGLGIEARWLGNARNPKEWRDTQVRVTGPVVGQMQAIFSEDWTYTSGEVLAGEPFYPPLEPTGSLPAQAIKVSRGDSSSLAEMLYFVAIQSASRSIHVQNAYFLPDRQVRSALVRAVRRGVDVRIMVPGRHIDVPPVRLASRLEYGEMLAAGVKVYEYSDTMLHCKTAVVDGIFSTIGSINFDARSMRTNAEESMAFYDRGFGSRMEEVFDQDIKHCHQVTYAEWQRRSLHARVLEIVSWFFEPLY
jgi:cardiolipin synthase A/B